MDTTTLRPGNFKLYQRIQQHLQAGGPATSGQPQMPVPLVPAVYPAGTRLVRFRTIRAIRQNERCSTCSRLVCGLWNLSAPLEWKSPFAALCCGRRHRHNGTAPHQHNSRSDYCRLQPCAGRRCARVHAILASQGACDKSRSSLCCGRRHRHNGTALHQHDSAVLGAGFSPVLGVDAPVSMPYLHPKVLVALEGTTGNRALLKARGYDLSAGGTCQIV